MTDDQAQFFSETFEEHYRAVLRFCRQRTPNIEDAADAASSTFMTAWRRIDDFVAVEYPRAWLYKVARLTMANQRRSNRRGSALADKIGTLALAPVPDAAESAIVETELAAALQALAQLPQGDQEIIALAAFESFGHHEIAETMGITAGQARSRLYRARQRLRDRFTEGFAT